MAPTRKGMIGHDYNLSADRAACLSTLFPLSCSAPEQKATDYGMSPRYRIYGPSLIEIYLQCCEFRFVLCRYGGDHRTTTDRQHRFKFPVDKQPIRYDRLPPRLRIRWDLGRRYGLDTYRSCRPGPSSAAVAAATRRRTGVGKYADIAVLSAHANLFRLTDALLFDSVCGYFFSEQYESPILGYSREL